LLNVEFALRRKTLNLREERYEPQLQKKKSWEWESDLRILSVAIQSRTQKIGNLSVFLSLKKCLGLGFVLFSNAMF